MLYLRSHYWCETCVAAAAVGSTLPHLCIPKTPKFATKYRTRKVTARSQAETEELEIEEMKKLVLDVINSSALYMPRDRLIRQ